MPVKVCGPVRLGRDGERAAIVGGLGHLDAGQRVERGGELGAVSDRAKSMQEVSSGTPLIVIANVSTSPASASVTPVMSTVVFSCGSPTEVCEADRR